MSTISASTTNTTAYKVTADTTGALVLQTGSGPTTAVTVDTSQNVGIGTSSPAQKLDVVGTTNRILWNVDSATFIESTLNAAGVSYVDKVTRANQFIFQTGTTERMRIDTSGNVGIGTSSPTEKLMVAGSIRVTSNANDFNVLGGQFDFATNATRISAYNSTGGIIQFFNNASGGTVLERARITSGGRLNIGTTGGSATRLEIQGDETTCVFINTSATDATYKTTMSFTDNGGAQRGTIKVNNSATQYNTSSDYRLKDNIQPMVGALAKVASLKPCTFNWKIDGVAGEGFIAHELAEVVPDAVAGEKDAVDAEGKPIYQGIDTSFLVATLTAAIQEQQAIITQLQSDVAALKGQA